MTDKNYLFFELIQVSLGTRSCLSNIPSADEWGELYAMAKKQSLVGICFAAVQRLPENERPPEMLYLTWMGMAAKIQQRNEVVNRQCVDLQNRLSADGFRSYIMKGQGNSALYRTSYVNDNENLCLLRQSGDIDVYLEGGLDKVLAYAQTFGETKQVNELEMHVDVFPDTEVEFHYMPFFMRSPIRNKRLQAFFDSKKEECFTNIVCLNENQNENEKLCICAPTAEFNLVHQLVHIYHHFITEGVGLRQLMDYYFVLKTLSVSPLKGECIKVVKEVISDLGLDRFATALMWVIAKVFANDGFDKLTTGNVNDNFFLWKPNEKDGRLLLEEVIKSGNFGHMDETKADLSNKWKSFWYVNGKTFRFWRFDHWAWFWSPLWRIYHNIWKKIKGFE